MDIDFYTKQEIDTTLDGVNFVCCTQTQYDEMSTHGDKTIYFAADDTGKVKMYLGDVLLMTGNAPENAAIVVDEIISDVGDATADITVNIGGAIAPTSESEEN